MSQAIHSLCKALYQEHTRDKKDGPCSPDRYNSSTSNGGVVDGLSNFSQLKFSDDNVSSATQNGADLQIQKKLKAENEPIKKQQSRDKVYQAIKEANSFIGEGSHEPENQVKSIS